MGACSHDTSGTASGIFIPISTQGAGLDSLEEQYCNGSLKKQPMSAGDDGQRYSADPTVFFGERNQKTTGEDVYLSPMNKSASGKNNTKDTYFKYSMSLLRSCIQNPLGAKIWGGMWMLLLGIQ